MEAGKLVKQEGKENHLLDMIAEDTAFDLSKEELDELMNAKLYTGCAGMQVDSLLHDYINPLLQENQNLMGTDTDISL